MDSRSKLHTAARNLAELVNMPFVIGFAAALTWMGVFYSVVADDAVGGVFTDSTANDVYLISLAANALTDIALALFPRQAFKFLEHKGRVVAPLFMVGATLLLALVPSMHAVGHLAALIGTAIAGISSVLFLLYWILSFGRMNPHALFTSLVIAYIAMNCSNILLSLSNAYTTIAFSLLLPLLSLSCLIAGNRAHSHRDIIAYYKPSSKQRGDGGGFFETVSHPCVFLVKLAAAFFLWALVNRTFRSIYATSINGDIATTAVMNGLATITVSVIVAGALVAMLLSQKQFRFEFLYRPVFLVTLAGITLLPVALSGNFPVIGYSLNTASYHMFCMYMWIIIAACCHNSPKRILKVYGSVGAAWSGGAACGVLLGQAVSEPIAETGGISPLVFGGVILLASCYLFIFTERDAAALAQLFPAQRRRPFREKCAGVARRHGLSAREQEVMELIAQGRDTAAIQERLALSASTVQTHRAHIYRKLNIHSKQELIDAIESEGLENTSFYQQV